MPIDEHGEEYMTLDEFFTSVDNSPVDTSPENIKRALQYMAWWLSVPGASRAIGLQALHDIQALMQFAQERLDS